MILLSCCTTAIIPLHRWASVRDVSVDQEARIKNCLLIGRVNLTGTASDLETTSEHGRFPRTGIAIICTGPRPPRSPWSSVLVLCNLFRILPMKLVASWIKTSMPKEFCCFLHTTVSGLLLTTIRLVGLLNQITFWIAHSRLIRRENTDNTAQAHIEGLDSQRYSGIYEPYFTVYKLTNTLQLRNISHQLWTVT